MKKKILAMIMIVVMAATFVQSAVAGSCSRLLDGSSTDWFWDAFGCLGISFWSLLSSLKGEILTLT
ncbi:MAG TPA: hypothetical protein VN285_10865 [Candidatus Deferrimicrobium sp.]|nr:hypothetical protein [Candidatus Deferrimicrobium sp.]